MAYVIDTRNSEDHLLVLGGGLGLPTSEHVVATPSDGTLRFNVTSDLVEVYSNGVWDALLTSGAAQPYVIALSSGATTLVSNQIIACHQFATAVTFPADFGSINNFTSAAGCLVAATDNCTFTLQRCPKAANPTVGGNWTTIGTAVIANGGHAATLATVSHAQQTASQGDFLRCVAPSVSDPSLSNFFITLVGTR